MGIHSFSEKGLENYQRQPVQDEKEIEVFLENHPQVLDNDLFIIGRQVITDTGKRIDLLGLDKNANVVIVELKQKQTPRDVVSQILEYGVWADDQTMESLDKIAKKQDKLGNFPSLWKKFESDAGETPEFNENQRWYIVAEKIDGSTKKVASYLRERNIDINCIEIQFFQKDNEKIVHTNMVVGNTETESTFEDDEEFDWEHYTKDLSWGKNELDTIKDFTQTFENYAKEKNWNPQIKFNKLYIALRDTNANRNYLSMKVRNGKIRLEVRLREDVRNFESTLDWKFSEIKKLWRTNLDVENMPKIEIFEKLFLKMREISLK